MRTIYRALIATSLLLASVNAVADITLVNTNSENVDSASANQHRYERAIKKMDSDSDQITNQLMNRGRSPNSENSASGDSMKVALIRIHR